VHNIRPHKLFNLVKTPCYFDRMVQVVLPDQRTPFLLDTAILLALAKLVRARTIFEFGKRRGQVSEREAELAQAEENLARLRNRVRIDVEKAVRKVNRAETEIASAREVLTTNTEARRLSSDQVEAGTANRSAFLESEASVFTAQADLLRALSPLGKLDRIKAPLMVQHGANDTNVPVVEAEQVVENLRKRGVPVEYILFPDEGHGWRKTVNRVKSDVALVEFFSKHLKAGLEQTGN